jgi:hypothetical protein
MRHGLSTPAPGQAVASIDEDVAHRQEWAKLMAENAPFRVVTPTGLASAPSDYFDPLLLAQASSEWRKSAYLVGNALGSSSKPYPHFSRPKLMGSDLASRMTTHVNGH